MRAIVMRRIGGPEVLELANVPAPEPEGRRGAGGDPRHRGKLVLTH
jgi:hypothetical protein